MIKKTITIITIQKDEIDRVLQEWAKVGMEEGQDVRLRYLDRDGHDINNLKLVEMRVETEIGHDK